MDDMGRKDVFKPFDADVEAHGGYQYTSPTRLSAKYANRRFSDIITSAFDFTGKSVVDVGCGDGTYTAVLREETSARSIVGIDPAAKAIERARSLYAERLSGLEFRNALASDLLAAGEHFDIAVYRGVIHHVGNPLAEISNAVKLADRVFFLEPNGLNPVLKLLERYSAYHREHDEKSYAESTFRKWIATCGGSVHKFQYFGLVPMFCPDWMVTVGASLEPAVERLPGIRAVCCGQVGITVLSAGAR